MTSNDYYGIEQNQQQDALNQTVMEILSSLSEGSKNVSKIHGVKDSDATATDGEPPVPSPDHLKRNITVNDRDRMKLYYDKSASMIAPKPQDVPIF